MGKLENQENNHCDIFVSSPLKARIPYLYRVLEASQSPLLAG